MLLALCAVAAPLARADGDPASDWLLQGYLFASPDSGISSADQSQLRALLLAAHKQGYTLHVAVIASRYDMGAVTVLYDRPHTYAPFLSEELRFFYKGRVLVVMRNGYAIARDGKRDPAEQKVLAGLTTPKPFAGPPLAAATERAIRRLLANAGVHVAVKPISAHGGSSTTRDRIVIGVAAAALLLLAGAFSYRRRLGAWWRRRSQ